jgi:hypothetical protein
MAKTPLTTEESTSANKAYLEEVDQVLTALRRLKNQSSIPFVRECLEAARADIAHLDAVDEEDEDDDSAEEDDDDLLDDDDDDFDDLDDGDEDDDEDDALDDEA